MLSVKKIRYLPALLAAVLLLTACSGSPPDEKSLQELKDKVEEGSQKEEEAELEEEAYGASEEMGDTDGEESAGKASDAADPVQEPEVPEKITCPTCKGAGKEFCTMCEGKGKHEATQFTSGYRCPYCEGTGYSNCWTCEGTGQADNPEYDAHTGGQDAHTGNAGGGEGHVSPDFSYDRSPYVCSKCKGAGSVMCTSCKGVGKKYTTKYAPNYGSGSSSYTETTTCRLCNGTGSSLCTLCGGTGER